MSLESLLERATIRFPHSLTLEETEQLFDYVAKTLSGRIEYTVTRDKFTDGIGILEDGEVQEGRSVQRGETEIGIKGRIVNKHFESATFTCQIKWGDHVSGNLRLSSLEFSTIPGYSVEEHRQSQVQLWDRIRERVNAYFEIKGANY